MIYVELVHVITKKDNWEQLKKTFKILSENSRISCMSIPVVATKRDSKSNRNDHAAMVMHWWEEIEQRSVRLALEYEYIFQTDITDCYGSLYTHSIAWAMHGKNKAKSCKKDTSLLGNVIDSKMQDMNEGQTNGVPQGSMLVDLVAELVLCYGDSEISKKANQQDIGDYQILRYRDDYRIFVKNPVDGEHVVKIISEVMYSLGLKLNSGKTISSNDVLTGVVKEDKIHWIGSVQRRHDLQKHLMLIRELSKAHPHSGSLVRALSKFNARLERRKKVNYAYEMISIVVDITLKNPRTYAICAAIISNLLPQLSSESIRKKVIKLIRRRFKKTPNTGHMQLWLQRITYPDDPNASYAEPVCELVAGKRVEIWNTKWVTSKILKSYLKPTRIVDDDMLEELVPEISREEVDLFAPPYYS